MLMFIPILLEIGLLMIGLYFITLGLWELRRGVHRDQYAKYMFTGLCIVFILLPISWFFVIGMQ
ncbi:hypothetical protein J416_06228 [Gracilibacillus halophilus YIM-C55.5]|uniref:Uncharacterized protein n=1 Tax=Gracilibacillus halophilus YIM-C55.5 TaxID=1308866 RepID=N4WX10_9BACI|nr:hypothetical protein [Gracilibacillus halophilus]ENH97586.1 hypothetical protein J416_06228 [Gracilibacillus halophilus YIM-C55.5]